MNISLPDSLKAFIDEQIAERGYATSSEYIRDLIRKELEREKFRGLIAEGLQSPSAGSPDFDGLRERIRRYDPE